MYDVRNSVLYYLQTWYRDSVYGRYSLGDARNPNPASASLIEEITKQQMEDVVSITLFSYLVEG